MKILVELNHPAHYHLFIKAAVILQKNNNEVAFITKQKDVLLNLIEHYREIFKIFNRKKKEKKKGFLNNIIWMLESDFKTYSIARKFKPDIMLGSNFSISHIGKLLRVPSLIWQEDDSEVIPYLSIISYPFASQIVAPQVCSVGKWKAKKISYLGYHELAYLHPNHFIPNIHKIEKYVDTSKPFYIIRFAKLTAHHDKGKTGITSEIAQKIIDILDPHGNIYITSERELETQFEKYRIHIKPKNIHHALYYADMYIGDSQTMAAEAAVLGTPSIRFNDFVGKLGYLEELEHKYGLTYGIKTSEPEKLYQKIEELLNTPNLKQEFQLRQQNMLADKIDVTAFMVWFIENYPESAKIMKENPDYQLRFK